MARVQVPSAQKVRWVFTLNNYNPDTSYKNHLLNPNFKIKRAVFGYETSDNHTRHLQGYVEFSRSVRLSFVRNVLTGAHWEGAVHSPLANFIYCTKSNNYECIGDFSNERDAVRQGGKRVSLSSQEVIKGLLSKKCSLQVMTTSEYARNHLYFDKIVRKIKEVETQNKLYEEWAPKKLRMWQFLVFRRVMEQGDRKVAWVCDAHGNNGKSFLCNFLNLVYNFQLFDGQMTTRDLALVLEDSTAGVCLDVCRSAEHTFDYSVLECLKNGYISTGKYSGRCVRFNSMRTVVFANFYPILNKLSQDRWDILTIGEGILSDNSQISVVDPKDTYAPERPTPNCNLAADFNVSAYLIREGVIPERARAEPGT